MQTLVILTILLVSYFPKVISFNTKPLFSFSFAKSPYVSPLPVGEEIAIAFPTHQQNHPHLLGENPNNT